MHSDVTRVGHRRLQVWVAFYTIHLYSICKLRALQNQLIQETVATNTHAETCLQMSETSEDCLEIIVVIETKRMCNKICAIKEAESNPWIATFFYEVNHEDSSIKVVQYPGSCLRLVYWWSTQPIKELFVTNKQTKKYDITFAIIIKVIFKPGCV